MKNLDDNLEQLKADTVKDVSLSINKLFYAYMSDYIATRQIELRHKLNSYDCNTPELWVNLCYGQLDELAILENAIQENLI